MYSTFLPKNAHPFVYLSLDIDPRNVDVNVHPTKREVQFLHEEEVIGLLVDEIGQKLASASASRTYTTQAFAPLTREDGDAPELTRASKIRRVAESPESDDDDDDRESQTGSRATKSAPAKALHLQTQLTAHFPGWSDAVTPESGGGRAASGGGGSSKPKLPPSKLVRVDSKARKIDSFLFRQNASEDKQSMTSAPSKPKKNPNVEEGGMEEERESIDEDLPAEEGDDMDAADSRSPEPLVVEDGDEDLPDKAARVATSIGPGSQEQSDLMVEEQVEAEGDTEKLPEENATATKSATADSRAPRPFVEVQLTSVLELRQSITDKMHRGITEIFRGHTFVGVVDSRLALLQHQIRLYMVNYREASRLLFEQLALKVFANFGRIHLDPPIPLLDAVLIAMDDERDEDGALSSGQVRSLKVAWSSRTTYSAYSMFLS